MADEEITHAIDKMQQEVIFVDLYAWKCARNSISKVK